MSFSPNNKFIATSSSGDNSVRIWSLKNLKGEPVKILTVNNFLIKL